MVRKLIESCPSCGGGLEITEVECVRCDTQIRSRYHPGPFSGLSEEQTTFLRIFVMSRGNLSEIEKRLGVSYPTVRAKLDEVIQRLSDTEPPAEQRSAPQGTEPSRLDAIVREAMERVGATIEQRVRHLGPHAPPPITPPSESEEATERREILAAVSRGEITPAEGLQRIRALGGTQ